MTLRFFVTLSGAFILGWLALTFFREVPMESYLRTPPPDATPVYEDGDLEIAADVEPDRVAVNSDLPEE